MSSRLRSDRQQYRGLLTPAQVAEGITSARRNAWRLVEDADLMLENKRWPSAVTLAVLAIEEGNKVSILRGLAMATNEEEAQAEWRAFRSHVKKNVSWILPDLALQGAKTLDDFAPMFHDDSDHPAVLEGLKQVATYSDCYGKAHWATPEDLTLDQLAGTLCATARLGLGTGPKVCTEREIQLWVEHLGPVWKTTNPKMKRGLFARHQAMIEEGLSDTDPDFLASFLGLE